MPSKQTRAGHYPTRNNLRPSTARHSIAHHHPEDPNVGIVRGRTGRGALLAAALTAAVTVAGVVLLALAVGGSH